MHGLGNDFIVFDAVESGAPTPAQIRALADRRTGIGFDQALMLEPPRRPGTHVWSSWQTAGILDQEAT